VFWAALLLGAVAVNQGFSQETPFPSDTELLPLPPDVSLRAEPEPVQRTDAENQFFFADAEEEPAPESACSIFAVIRILFVLVLVACAIYGFIFILKKGTRRGAVSDPWLKVLALTPINQRNAAAVVAVGQQAWLVGSAEGSVSLIAEITDRETVDAMLLEQSEREAAASKRLPAFNELLQRLAPQRGAAPKKDFAAKSTVSGAALPRMDGIQNARSRLGAL
jgi:flagellar biogenesis protein FliO